MRHDLTSEGIAFKIRPVREDDAEFIISLRNNPDLNQYLHQTSNQVSDQIEWLRKYFERAGDYYFVIERQETGAAEGLISIYDVDESQRIAEWGRWILKPKSLAAVESAMLIYQVAFNSLNLKTVFCRTVADNKSVVSFHDSCGIPDKKLLPDHFSLNGRSLDAVEHRVDFNTYQKMKPKLETLARATARMMSRG